MKIINTAWDPALLCSSLDKQPAPDLELLHLPMHGHFSLINLCLLHPHICQRPLCLLPIWLLHFQLCHFLSLGCRCFLLRAVIPTYCHLSRHMSSRKCYLCCPCLILLSPNHTVVQPGCVLLHWAQSWQELVCHFALEHSGTRFCTLFLVLVPAAFYILLPGHTSWWMRDLCHPHPPGSAPEHSFVSPGLLLLMMLLFLLLPGWLCVLPLHQWSTPTHTWA